MASEAPWEASYLPLISCPSWWQAQSPPPAPAPLLPRTGGTPQGQAPLVGLAQRQPAPQTAATQAKGVVFQDNNKDDPVQWSYTYVTLRGNATP